MGINQRVSLRKFVDDIRRWVDEDRSDEWIASALGTSSSSVQSFRSRNGIYRRVGGAALYSPTEYSSFEGVIETSDGTGVWLDPEVGGNGYWKKGWSDVSDVDLHITPTRIYITRRDDS